MKKRILLIALIAAFGSIVFSSYHTGGAVSAGVDGTLASGASVACGGCHGSSTLINVTVELDSSGIPVTHYVPGMFYTLKITGVNGTSSTLPKFGFQVAMVKSAGAGTSSAVNAGTLGSTGLPAGVRYTPASALPIDILEQDIAITATTGTGTTGTTYVVSNLPWTAPSAGTGTVMLYGCINAVNGDGGASAADNYNHTTGPASFGEWIVAPISGTPSVCVGATTTLTDGTTGGTWSSGSTGIATISTTGVVTGVSPGTTLIYYDCGSFGVTSITVTVNPLPVTPPAITGTATVCVGATTTLIESVFGGTWSSSNPAIATVGTTGIVTGASTGTVTISYTNTNSCGSASAIRIVTVNTVPATPPAITGIGTVCVGAATILHDATAFGTWTSSNTAIATVFGASGTTGGSSGTVTGVSGGTVTISYSVSNSCGSASAITIVTVNAVPTPPPPIFSASLCVGDSTTLFEIVGGVWSSTNPSVATISSTGRVLGVSSGTTTISYTVSNSCGSAAATSVITVNAVPVVPIITGGTSSMCFGTTTTFTDSLSGGHWATSNTIVASIDSVTGVLSGIAPGVDTVTYTVTNACGSATKSTTITVTSTPSAGIITGLSTVCAGSVITLADAVTGGLWSSSNTNATITGTGVVTGVAAGVDTISYLVVSACGTATATKIITVGVSTGTGTIAGAATVCRGSITTLTETITGGTWSSSSPTIATISTTGTLTAITAGTDVISYSVVSPCGTAAATYTVTVLDTPTAGVITGPVEECLGSSILLTDSHAGGVWSSTLPSVATVSVTGTVTGISAGSTIISYTISNICGSVSDLTFMNVDTLLSPGIIVGTDSVCVGYSITLSDASSSGTWSSLNANASLSGAGIVVTGVSVGADSILYTATNVCGTTHTAHFVNVVPASHCWPVAVNATNALNDKINIYPNPSTGIFTVELPEVTNGATISIINLIGNVVATKTLEGNASATVTFSLKHLPAGSYIIKAVVGDKTYREKVIIW